jgi:hypothetical protein
MPMSTVLLARYRSGAAGEAAREVHMFPLPLGAGAGAGAGAETGVACLPSALCGVRWHPAEFETVEPSQGMPCAVCYLAHVTRRPPSPEPVSAPDPSTAGTPGVDRVAVGAAYRKLGWPVTMRRDQVLLSLDLDVDAVALIIPAALGLRVVEILLQRRCPPPVLAHPYMPEHRVIVAGERFGVPLAWPAGMHRIGGTLLLPPTLTARGPVRWERPPHPDSLALCREIDVFAALRTALSHPRADPAQPPSGALPA